jgi:hypothetical protein
MFFSLPFAEFSTITQDSCGCQKAGSRQSLAMHGSQELKLSTMVTIGILWVTDEHQAS